MYRIIDLTVMSAGSTKYGKIYSIEARHIMLILVAIDSNGVVTVVITNPNLPDEDKEFLLLFFKALVEKGKIEF
jgi:hypothetical protein